MTEATHLVIGATGFLGSHVVRKLVAEEHTVRILVRATSDTRPSDDLPLDRVVGELTDPAAVEQAMDGCEVVIYCAVDTRAWLIDPAPLFATNVEALRAVLDVAVRHPLRRFVFTSSMSTIGYGSGGVATEADAFDLGDRAGAYVRSRVAAEDLVLEYARTRGLPATAMCVANTYGAGDWQPTPHGAFVAGAALGRLPFTVKGFRAESVSIEDAALALVLAAEHGRTGERYIVAERAIDLGEVIALAAAEAGRRPPRLVLGKRAMTVAGWFGGVRARLTGRPARVNPVTVRLMHSMPAMDHTKAERELGWHPTPVPDAIRAGARFWLERRAARSAAAERSPARQD